MDFLPVSGRGAPDLSQALLSNEIQEGKDISRIKRQQTSTSGAADGRGQHVDSDGNRVNVGNFNADGLNVNNNWDDNRNDNIGVSASRKSPLCPREECPPA